MAESDSSERTEQATRKRMKEVHSKGQLSRSVDLSAWIGVGAAALMIPTTLAVGADAGTMQLFETGIATREPEPATALRALSDGLWSMVATLGPLLAVVAVAVLIAAVVQGGVHVKRFTGTYTQFNLVTGMKRIFGGQALWQGAKALLKTAVVGTVLFVVVQGLMPVLMTAGALPLSSLLEAAGQGVTWLLQAAVVAGLVLAAADALVVMRRNRKKTRMTKREVRDENKHTDGDPLIKAQRRSRQLAMSRNRMIAAVGGADVVLVNPTHIAIALAYEPGKSAPRVVAKGADRMALRIREEAEQHNVPIVKDVPLARMLHAVCDLGHEIPADLYDAVARVLVFVMALRKRGTPAGVHDMPATSAPAASASPASAPPASAPAASASTSSTHPDQTRTGS